MPHEQDPSAGAANCAEPHEAIVIGSGFGGAVTACRLAQFGCEVLILERGRRYEAGDMPPLPNDHALLPDLRRWTWNPEQGLWDILDLEELVSIQAAAYGGGSIVYANVHLRAPKPVFADPRWPFAYRNGEELEPFYDLAGFMLDAAPITEHPQLRNRLAKTAQLGRAMDRLGRGDAFFHPPLAVSRRNGPNLHGVDQKACTGCGACVTGCPSKAKNTLDYNYLALAERFGARVRTQCEVLDIVERRADGQDVRWWEVQCLDHLTGRRRAFTTGHLFVCAGSVHSTRLLARARLIDPTSQARLRDLAGTGYFPGGDAVGVVFDTQNEQRPSVGPCITTATVHWTSKRRGEFFLIQDGGYADAVARFVGLLRASAWTGRNRLTTRPEKPAPPLQSDPGMLERPLPDEDVPDLSHVPPEQLLPSPLDALLDALAAGDAKGISSAELRAHVHTFIGHLAEPTLLPSVVHKVIDGALLDRLAGLGFLRDPVLGFVRGLIRTFLATDERFADHAIRALLSFSGLPRAEVAKKLLGFDAESAKNRTMLLAMGRDAAEGNLIYDRGADRMIADLDLALLSPGYTAEEQLMSDVAAVLGGELRTSPAWAFLGKPVTVHNQGGCPMSDDPLLGVVDADGKVHGVNGLYVIDGSILPTSVGVNPSGTIAALAERNVRRFLRVHPPARPSAEGRALYAKHLKCARDWARRANEWNLRPPDGAKVAENAAFRQPPVGIRFSEHMQGHWSQIESGECIERRLEDDAKYRRHEALGRPLQSLTVDLTVSVADLATFVEDKEHRMRIEGTATLRFETGPPLHGPVSGELRLFAARHKPYGIPPGNGRRRRAQLFRMTRAPKDRSSQPNQIIARNAARKAYATRVDRPARGRQRFMIYELGFDDHPDFRLSGYKRIRDDAGIDAWRDTSALFVTILERGVEIGAGVIRVDLSRFLFNQLHSLKVTGTDDPERVVWAATKFAAFFFGSLQRIYQPELRSVLDTLLAPRTSKPRKWPLGPGR